MTNPRSYKSLFWIYFKQCFIRVPIVVIGMLLFFDLVFGAWMRGDVTFRLTRGFVFGYLGHPIGFSFTFFGLLITCFGAAWDDYKHDRDPKYQAKLKEGIERRKRLVAKLKGQKYPPDEPLANDPPKQEQ